MYIEKVKYIKVQANSQKSVPQGIILRAAVGGIHNILFLYGYSLTFIIPREKISCPEAAKQVTSTEKYKKKHSKCTARKIIIMKNNYKVSTNIQCYISVQSWHKINT